MLKFTFIKRRYNEAIGFQIKTLVGKRLGGVRLYVLKDALEIIFKKE